MATRWTRTARQTARQLSTSTSAQVRPASRTTAYAAATLLVGTTVGLAVGYPGLKDRFVVRAEAAKIPDTINQDVKDGHKQDPDTSILHPVTLPLSTPTSPLTLVGLGVRTVSFLSVRVYSAAFYVEDRILKQLHNVAGWHNYSSNLLLQPPSKSSVDAPKLTGEQLMSNLLDSGAECAVRIVPVRNTDFSHLRDGFTRAVLARQKLARAADRLSEADETRIAESLQALKALFPAQSVPKGKALVLLRTPNGLSVEYEGARLGYVNDAWVAKELMMAYFADKDVISPKLKQDVARGFEELYQAK